MSHARNANHLKEFIKKLCMQKYDAYIWEEIEAAYKCHSRRSFAWKNPFFESPLFGLDLIEDSSLEWKHLEGRYFRHKVSANQRCGAQKLKPLVFMSLSSTLSIDALDLGNGKASRPLNVLDMCAAPGGKAVLIGWTMPKSSNLIANELLCERRWRLARTLECYLPDQVTYEVSSLDGIHFGQLWKGSFDRVLLDAPCTNDRYLFSNQVTMEQIYRSFDDPSELQKELLVSAISACKVGGIVVYCTCTIDERQNDGVINWLLQSPFLESVKVENVIIPKVLADQLNLVMTSHGYLILPSVDRNWGPLFVSKLRIN